MPGVFPGGLITIIVTFFITLDYQTITLHAQTAILAIEQGKDVICEVPVCPTLEEAEQIAKAARRTGRRVFVDLFDRVSTAHRFLREKITSGEYGRLLPLQVVNRCAPVRGAVPLGLDVLPLESCSCDFDWPSWCLGALTLSGVSSPFHLICGRTNGNCPADILCRLRCLGVYGRICAATPWAVSFDGTALRLFTSPGG
ncbi:Gfo/Idh/MocA family oxidoreductase [uncultured Oscillibacter sp.]|uniref:Gfo/Idh/MocA family protein n=1 Tax=uncultured Oscillibacter sp. TaxID=876091 RepID=UPI0034512077